MMAGGPRFAAPWPSRIAIVGAAGLVGSSIANAVIGWGRAREIVLVDVREALLTAQLVDLRESALLAGRWQTSVSKAPVGDLRDVDIVVVAASNDGDCGDRRASLNRNWQTLHELSPHLARAVASRGLVVIVSNPVNVLCDRFRRLGTVAADRIIGYTANDTLRFRDALASELREPVQHVRGWVLGEHGDAQVPLFSRVLCRGQRVELSEDERRRVLAHINGWFGRWVGYGSGRSTAWATAAGVLQLCRCLARGGDTIAGVASRGAYGVADSCLTLPIRVSREGVRHIRRWRLVPSERDLLAAAARSIQQASLD